MTPKYAKEVLDKIIGQICGYKNPYDLDQFIQKYAFDVRLPVQVNDSTTGETTWSQSANPLRYITMDNARKRSSEGWMLPKRPLNSIDDILSAWNEGNLTTTERQIDSLNIAESDNIYNSEYIYRSQDINRSKYILLSDGVMDSECVVAGQRSNTCTFCVRVEDSKECSNSFSVIWSGKVVNSFFINDCYDIYECLFCSHLTSAKFCVANMQFTEEEYFKLKDMVIRWVLTA